MSRECFWGSRCPNCDEGKILTSEFVYLEPTDTEDVWKVFDRGCRVDKYAIGDLVYVNDYALEHHRHENKNLDMTWICTFEYNILGRKE